MHHTGIKTVRFAVICTRIKDFNCTIQELKLMQANVDVSGDYDFNCTIQELKPTKNDYKATCLLDFNCTIQELKLEDGEALINQRSISIAPYRN